MTLLTSKIINRPVKKSFSDHKLKVVGEHVCRVIQQYFKCTVTDIRFNPPDIIQAEAINNITGDTGLINYKWTEKNEVEYNRIFNAGVYKIVFFKMPKVASDYIWRTLYNSYNSVDYLNITDESYSKLNTKKVTLDVLRHNELSSNTFKVLSESDYSFCFVRNPYLRFVSNWRYCVKNSMCGDEIRFRKICYDKKIFPNPDVSFSDFEIEKNTFLGFCRNLNKIIEYGPGEFTLWLPQYYWIHRYNRCLVDFVGRYEHLEEDLRKVYNKLGLECNVKFGNNSKNESIKSQLKYKDFYFNGEIVDRVYNFYKRDFEQFGYERDIDKTFLKLENKINTEGLS